MMRWEHAFDKTFVNRVVNTCSFAVGERFEEIDPSITPVLETGGLCSFVKNNHFRGDWNSIDFHRKMMKKNENKQWNAIVFKPIWWHPGSGDDETKSAKDIAKMIGKMCEERFRESFFCHVLKFIADNRCLKENGVLVFPFHPRIIAGLAKHVGWEWVDTENVKVLENIDRKWIDTMKTQRTGWKEQNGFDNKLEGTDFERELTNLGKTMKLRDELITQIIGDFRDGEHPKHITVKGENFHKAMDDTDRTEKKDEEKDDEKLFVDDEMKGEEKGIPFEVVEEMVPRFIKTNQADTHIHCDLTKHKNSNGNLEVEVDPKMLEFKHNGMTCKFNSVIATANWSDQKRKTSFKVISSKRKKQKKTP